MRRRSLLAAAATTGTALLAGCPSRDGTGGGGGGDGTDDEGTGMNDGGDGGTNGAGGERPTPTGSGARLSVTSSAFADGDRLPTRYTCDGAGVSPPLAVGGVPDGAQTLALVVDDPDAPTDEPFVHWLVWNVPADLTDWPADVSTGERAPELDDAPQGTNTGGELGYFPACPPKGDGPHRYRFTASAVDQSLNLDPGAKRDALASALDGHVLATGRLVGTYERG